MKKKSTKEKLYDLLKVETEYKLIIPYTTYKSKIRLKHLKCGHEWDILPDNFVRNGNRCPKCANKKKGSYHKKTIKDFIAILDEDYKCLDKKYINNTTPIKIKHLKCGTAYSVSYVNYKKGKRCPYCAEKEKIKRCKERLKSNEYFLNKINEFSDSDEYEVMEKYRGTDVKIKFKHKICGHEFRMTPNMFYRGRRCPLCNNTSNGELRIKKYLDNNNFSYEREVSFEELKSKKGFYLRFDFLIYLNKEDYILLEYDGKQHFEDVKYYSSNLSEIQYNDNLKNIFCEEFDIPLYRIKYTDLQYIENILDDILKVQRLSKE